MIILLDNTVLKYLDRVKQRKRDKKDKKLAVKTLMSFIRHQLIDTIIHSFKIIYFMSFILLSYLYISLLFSLFSLTSNWSTILLGYIVNPLKSLFTSFINYLPNVFTIIIIILVIQYILKIIKIIFSALDKGAIVFPNFYKDWAQPTYKIIRFLIIVLGLVVIFPYLPGSDSPFFKGISIFIGVLFSFGSSSAIANIVAGLVITYMRPFKEGDFVRIADTQGKITEKSILVTRVRTIKNVDITIPNAVVLNSHIINFSTAHDEHKLILHTPITMGYEYPWQKIHKLLLTAVDDIDFVLKEPKPFILQTALDDDYVKYELNAYTDNPLCMAATLTEIHKRILDVFSEAGIDMTAPKNRVIIEKNKTENQ
jgi:small-conductance mechanosensitive channel